MAAFVSNMRNIWSSTEQNRQIFNWRSILEEWNQSLNMHPYVQTVIDNLKIASDSNDEYDFPLAHFQKFLNWEREGLTWFLYEVVSMRYMFGGETRIDYIHDLVQMNEIHLDEGFPVFPGSPKNYRTVRQFLHDNLSEDELEFVEMMPALVNPSTTPPYAPSTPPRPIRPSVEAPGAPLRLNNTGNVQRPDMKNYVPVELRVIPDAKDKTKDIIIHIKKQQKLFEEHYSISYKDGKDGFHTMTKDMTRGQVLRYLSTTFRLLAIDEDPNALIQLSMPNAPIVMLPNRMNSYTRDLVYDAVEGVMDSWPCSV